MKLPEWESLPTLKEFQEAVRTWQEIWELITKNLADLLSNKREVLANLKVILEVVLSFLLKFGLDEDISSQWKKEPLVFPDLILERPSEGSLDDIKGWIIELVEKSETYMKDAKLWEEFNNELKRIKEFWSNCDEVNFKCVDDFLRKYIGVSFDINAIHQGLKSDPVLSKMEILDEDEIIYYAIGLLIIEYLFIVYPMRAVLQAKVSKNIWESPQSNLEAIMQALLSRFWRDPVAMKTHIDSRWGHILPPVSDPRTAEEVNMGNCWYASFLVWSFLRAEGIKDEDVKFVFVPGHVFVIINNKGKVFKIDLAHQEIGFVDENDPLLTEESTVFMDPGWGYLWLLLQNYRVHEILKNEENIVDESSIILRAYYLTFILSELKFVWKR